MRSHCRTPALTGRRSHSTLAGAVMSDPHLLLQRVIAGDPAAWREFQALVEPTISAIARRHRGLRGKNLGALPDDLREIVVASLERLARDNFANLRRFQEHLDKREQPFSQALDNWLYGAVDFVIREHIRQRFGRAPKPPSDESKARPLAKRDLHTLAGRLGDRGHGDSGVERSFMTTMSMTTKLTVAEIFSFIEGTFSAQETRALRLYYLEDRSFAEVARALDLEDEKTADRLIRKLNARLRYHFVVPEETAAN